jgi:hypothetical protein
MTVSLEDQIRCVAREIKIREGVYPQQVRTGRMRRDVADLEIARMTAVLETLKGLQERVEQR